MEWALLSHCGICKRFTFFIKKRQLTLPTGLKVTSQKMMCKTCYTNITNLNGISK